METVGRFVTAIIALVLVGTGLYYAINYNLRDFGSPSLVAAPIVVDATTTPVQVVVINPTLFESVGTIVYYVQQGVEVPYLFYTKGGATASKALEFTNESICVTAVQAPCPSTVDAFKTQFGSGPVDVQGTVSDESLIVTRISMASV